jgi:dihydrofolate synthase / folylpolyglutamate synthase
VILTDSHTTPLRKGVLGVALSYAGFEGVNDFVASPICLAGHLK